MTGAINTGMILEALNDKVDRDCRNVDTNSGADIVIEWQAPTAANNYTWYRLYKSGWVEQGGYIANPSNTENNITFVKAFNDNFYYFNRINYSTVNGTATNFACEGYSNKTTTGITVYTLTAYSGAIYWEAKGFAAQS